MSAKPSRPSLPKVSVVGRPNVGKSTLFNRLLGRREAIVHDRPGVTRDRIERTVRLEHRAVRLEDTGGILPDAEEELLREVTRQALRAAEEADLLVLVVDGRRGVTPLDESIATSLRGSGVPLVVAVNKIDVPQLENEAVEAWRLGLGEPVPVSAEHGAGIDELVAAIEAALPAPAPSEEDLLDADDGPAADPAEELHVAVVGRPNVGKSSLLNRLIGAERVTVSARPGTTRDAVDVLLERDGRRFRLVDTAGIRRRSRVETRDESVGILMARRRLDRAHAAIVVVDATEGITSGDQAVVGEVIERGRPFVLAVNKWDLVENREQRSRELADLCRRKLAFGGTIPRVTLSALTGQRVFRLLDEVAAAAAEADRRIPTPELNRFLQRAVQLHRDGGADTPKALYITQTGVLPPRFVVFCRRASQVSEPFRRYLERRLREEFGFDRVPVRVALRESQRTRP